MAFALKKDDGEKKPHKRSPLAGWLGRKSSDDEFDGALQIDVAAGVSRALRGSRMPAAKPREKDVSNPVREALASIEAALYAIDKIREILEQATEVTLSARELDDAGGRALLAERYDELRLSVDAIIDSADPRAATLIGRSQRHLDVNLGGKTRYSVSSARLDCSESGLNLPPPGNAFADDGEVDGVLDALDGALSAADRTAAAYCRDAQYLIARMNGAFG